MLEILPVIGRRHIYSAAQGCLVLLMLTWGQWVFAQGQGSVSASLSTTRIAFEDSVTLEVVARGVDGDIDTSELEQVFDITARSESQQVRIVNGVNDSLRRWQLQLIPRSVGELTVPSVRVGGVASNPLSLTVGEAPSGADRVLFVELEIDEPTPWVQQQIYMTLSVFYRINIEQYQIDHPQADGISMLPIEGEVTRDVERDGVAYRVLEKRFAAFPQQSGVINLSPFTLTALVPADPSRVRGFLSPTRRITRRTDPIELDVQPRPDDVTANWWLPSSALELTEEWIDDPANAQVGKPLSRQLRISASGVLSTQLPDVDAPDVDGISVYADEPDDQTIAEADSLVSERVINWAIIPQRAGALVLPPVEIEWFDTVSGTAQVARLPEQTIDVAAVAGSIAQTPTGGTSSAADSPGQAALIDSAPSESEQEAPPIDALALDVAKAGFPWKLLASVALVGWVVTAGMLVWRERSRVPARPFANNQLDHSKEDPLLVLEAASPAPARP